MEITRNRSRYRLSRLLASTLSHALVGLLVIAATGTVAFAAIAARNSVTSASIKDGDVRTADLRKGSVTTVKLKARAVSTAKIAPGAVRTSQIAANSVTSALVRDGSITAQDLAPGVLTASSLAAGSITSDLLAAGSVTSAKLGDDSVTTAKLATGAVTTAKIADGSVTTSKIATGGVDSVNIVDETIKADDIAAESIPIGKIDPVGGSNGQLLSISGGNATWTTADYAPLPSRSVLVRSGGSSVDNGTALRSAISSLASPSATYRWHVLVEPGTYDIGGTSIALPDGVTVSGSTGVPRDVQVTSTAGAIFTVASTFTAGLTSMTLNVVGAAGSATGVDVAGDLEIRNVRGSLTSTGANLTFAVVGAGAELTNHGVFVEGSGGVSGDLAAVRSTSATSTSRWYDSAASMGFTGIGTSNVFVGDGTVVVDGTGFGVAYEGAAAMFGGSTGSASYSFSNARLAGTISVAAGDSMSVFMSLVPTIGGGGTRSCVGAVSSATNSLLNSSCA